MPVRIVLDKAGGGVRFANTGLYDRDVLAFERAVKQFWVGLGGVPRRGVRA